MGHRATARLFAALELPDAARSELARWGRSAAVSARRNGGELRSLRSELLHITLCFLGARPVGEIDALADALRGACAGAAPIAELTLGAPLWLPPRRPHALAIEVHDDGHDGLRTLHDDLARAFEAVSDFRREPRRFRAHVTVARLRPHRAPRERALDATPALAFRPLHVTLYRSWLTPTEARYEGLATNALAAPSG